MSDFNKAFENYSNYRNMITNESQTKQYLIVPVLSVLGYDVNNPTQVVSEFTADVAGRQNEKIDYVIRKDNKIVILIECKHHTSKLERKDREQLERYFNCREQVDHARFAILTNGVFWNFYSDSQKSGVLDKDPFFVFKLDDPETWKKVLDFSIKSFDEEKIYEHAKARNLIEAIKNNFFDMLFSFNKDSSMDQARNIMENLSRSGIDLGRLTEAKIQETKQPFIDARDEFVRNYILSKMNLSSKEKESSAETSEAQDEFIEYEYKALNIVQSILAEFIEPERIVIRNRTGLGNSVILLDDNQRKSILRVNFTNQENLKIQLPNQDWVEIHKLTDIYKYKQQIMEFMLVHSN